MNLLNLFDAQLGGKTRAALTVVLTVIAWAAAIAGAVDLDAPIGVSILAVVQVIAHGTPFGNREVAP